MKIKLTGLIAALFAMTSIAHAGLLLDPYVGFGSGTIKLTSDASSLESDDSESMSTVGARVGLSVPLFSAGIDYEMMTISDLSLTNTALFVGVNLPLIRAWAEYIVSSKYDDSDDNNSDEVDFQSGYGLGIGFTGLPFVSINLDIKALTYQREVLGVDVDYAIGTTVLSISLPLDL